jgi:hypothetical protein
MSREKDGDDYLLEARFTPAAICRAKISCAHDRLWMTRSNQQLEETKIYFVHGMEAFPGVVPGRSHHLGGCAGMRGVCISVP